MLAFTGAANLDKIFQFDGDDKIDLSALLGKFSPAGDIDDFVKISHAGNYSLAVDVDGAQNGHNFVDAAVIITTTPIEALNHGAQYLLDHNILIA